MSSESNRCSIKAFHYSCHNCCVQSEGLYYRTLAWWNIREGAKRGEGESKLAGSQEICTLCFILLAVTSIFEKNYEFTCSSFTKPKCTIKFLILALHLLCSYTSKLYKKWNLTEVTLAGTLAFVNNWLFLEVFSSFPIVTLVLIPILVIAFQKHCLL